MSHQAPRETVRVAVENIGGIDRTEVELVRGTNVLSGRNATNRTSFLQALIAATGGENASLKGDAESGRVELSLGDDRYVRHLERRDGRVVFSGDPVLDDSTLADLFAFVLEDNPARQAAMTGGDLREILMRPVDTDEIRAEITSLKSERRRLDERIERVTEKRGRLAELNEEANALEADLDAKRDELSAKRDELDALDGDVAESRTTQDELDEAMATLRELRDEREDVEFERETERESRDAYRADLAEHRDALEALDPASDAERAALEADISSLRDRRQSLDATINQLQRIVQFNEEMLDGEHPEVRGALTDADGAVTDRLVEDRTVCWTCGSEVERDAIGGTLERIRSLRQEKEAERRDLADRIDSLRDEKRAHDERASERERHEARVDDLEAELAASEERIAELDERASDLDDRIAAAEDRVNDLEAAAQSDVLSAHREVTQLEFERDRLADELAEVESEREDVEATLAELPDLEAERERVAADITDLRTRVERMEDDAVESFNDHMARLLDRLAYDNLDRIWIERTGRDGGESASAFALHVVRQTDDGRAYEDTVDHLSESEREVVGLVFALAGYLVHEVYEACPFMLLDSLEAIDSDRIAALVDYFDAFPDYLVVALLEEDARALDEGYHRIESI